METEEILKHLRASNPSELVKVEPFGMSKQLAGGLHRSLSVSVPLLLSPVARRFVCTKVSCHLFPRPVGVLSFKPVYLQCFPSSCVVVSVRPDERVPIGGIAVSALETLFQLFVRDALSGVVAYLSACTVLCHFDSCRWVVGGRYSNRRRQWLSAADPSVSPCGKRRQNC